MMKDSLLYHTLKWHLDCGVFEITRNCLIEEKEEMRDMTLPDLKNNMKNVECQIRYTAKNFVFGDGSINSDIVFVGEAPGSVEDEQGLPFVGQSGELLNKMIESIGLKREYVYITNIVPWRPPGNRTPSADEMALFRPFLIQHLKIIKPKLVVCLGSTASKALLQTQQSISTIRSKFFEISEISAKILPTFHPSYLMRSPVKKREAWEDFLKIKDFLEIHKNKTAINKQ